ncbi:Putative ribosome biogenesis GTPase RsgA [Roseimaritima multifibrata]|uniref:Small ribosomal subunit biogenesis GTPase RsgA n=1 Tax=Roseimaritima multifibrata TaxID=1930274 RepID=A0A517MFR2_9BACT|nr:ribosome small subunit-dependent GTPase A [Roseimaritima multifibrata]QDS93729.1 Putative ribosome biogenesis GTPase RsgA [Roseimaritima multifibrata]
MSAKKSSGDGRKVRAEFRKKHQGRVRESDLTRRFQQGDTDALEDAVKEERVSGKGDLTRHRTIMGSASNPGDSAGLAVHLDVDAAQIGGRVLSVHGLQSRVRGEDGVIYECTVRQLLKSLTTDQRHVVVAGDHVAIRVGGPKTGTIERIKPRTSELSRTSKGRQHVIVANVDYLLIVASAAEPGLKPNLIDRFLLTAEQFRIQPIICINKMDLISPAEFQPIMGVYAQLGYRVLLTSAETGQGVPFLKALVKDSQTVVAGQSGVGKSSLLNALEPDLALRIGKVSAENSKGKHTTTASQLIPLAEGGYVVDTPGIRQFQLWDITVREVGGLMRDLRPFVNACRYPDCIHFNEDECAVKDAVADGHIDARRYDAYCQIIEDLQP